MNDFWFGSLVSYRCGYFTCCKLNRVCVLRGSLFWRGEEVTWSRLVVIEDHTHNCCVVFSYLATVVSSIGPQIYLLGLCESPDLCSMFIN